MLKKNISDLWVKHFTQERDDVVFMDTAIIAHPTTWQASGHLASFSDALIDDKKTGKRFRADKIIEDFLEKSIDNILQTNISNAEKDNSYWDELFDLTLEDSLSIFDKEFVYFHNIEKSIERYKIK